MFIAKLGGWMGLVLGASIFSILEVFGFLVCLISRLFGLAKQARRGRGGADQQQNGSGPCPSTH